MDSFDPSLKHNLRVSVLQIPLDDYTPQSTFGGTVGRDVAPWTRLWDTCTPLVVEDGKPLCYGPYCNLTRVLCSIARRFLMAANSFEVLSTFTTFTWTYHFTIELIVRSTTAVQLRTGQLQSLTYCEFRNPTYRLCLLRPPHRTPPLFTMIPCKPPASPHLQVPPHNTRSRTAPPARLSGTLFQAKPRTTTWLTPSPPPPPPPHPLTPKWPNHRNFSRPGTAARTTRGRGNRRSMAGATHRGAIPA